MTAAGVLSRPAPEVTDELARIALAAWADAARRPVRTDGLRGLPAVDGLLRAWATAIATTSGFPLLGTGLSAPTYPALLWNGARLDPVAGGPSVDGSAPVLLAALAAAEETASLDQVGRALAAADRVQQTASVLLGDTPVARPTLSTLGSATAAALVGPRAGDGLDRVLDLAASLMVLAPGADAGAGSLSWAGHAAASGWLAATLPDDAATPMAGSVVHTLSAAAGRAVTRAVTAPTHASEVDQASEGSEESEGTVGALLEALR